MNDSDHVVLVNKQNKVLGTSPKLTVHNQNTPLHRGFSVFLFNPKGELLLQQRSSRKKTWPLIWSNSCCGHPKLDESNTDAAKRRLQFELGLKVDNIHEVLSDFFYKAELNGITENELCPVLIAFTGKEPKLNRDEVEDFKWFSWEKFVDDMNKHPRRYSPWCEKETRSLSGNKKFIALYKKYMQ